jgi:hypothetical protein
MSESEGDASADAQLVVGGIFSVIAKLWSAMRDELPNVTLEDLVEVMFGDAEYWAKHPVDRSRSPQG